MAIKKYLKTTMKAVDDARYWINDKVLEFVGSYSTEMAELFTSTIKWRVNIMALMPIIFSPAAVMSLGHLAYAHDSAYNSYFVPQNSHNTNACDRSSIKKWNASHSTNIADKVYTLSTIKELEELCKEYNRPDIVREIFSLYMKEFRIPEKEALELTRLLAIYLDYCNDGKKMKLEADKNLPDSSYYEILDLQKVLPTDSGKLKKRLDEMQKFVVSNYTIEWFDELNYLASIAKTQGKTLDLERLKKIISVNDVILVGYDQDYKYYILDLSKLKDDIAYLLYNKTSSQEFTEAFLNDKKMDSPFAQGYFSELEGRYPGFMKSARERIRNGEKIEVITPFTSTLESFIAEKSYNPDDFVPEVDNIAHAIVAYRKRFINEAKEAEKIIGGLGYPINSKKQPEKAPEKTIIAPMPYQFVRLVQERLEEDGKKCATILPLKESYSKEISGRTPVILVIEGKKNNFYFSEKGIIDF